MDMELQAPVVSASATAPARAVSAIPWEDPEQSPLVGFFKTLSQLLTHPGKFFENLGREGWADPLAFSLIAGTTGFLFCLYWELLLGVGLSQRMAATPGISQIFVLSARVTLILMLLSPVLVLVNLVMSSLGLWLGVTLMGAGKAAFMPVWRITNYTQGAMAMSLIPFLGWLAALCWILWLTYKGVKQIFSLGKGRALGALAISLALEVILLLLFLGIVAGLAGRMSLRLLFG